MENEIITRAIAVQFHLKRYFTGVPCNKGHIAQRLACNGGCCECRGQKDIDEEIPINKPKPEPSTNKINNFPGLLEELNDYLENPPGGLGKS
jgi:hypothetical protein